MTKYECMAEGLHSQPCTCLTEHHLGDEWKDWQSKLSPEELKAGRSESSRGNDATKLLDRFFEERREEGAEHLFSAESVMTLRVAVINMRAALLSARTLIDTGGKPRDLKLAVEIIDLSLTATQGVVTR